MTSIEKTKKAILEFMLEGWSREGYVFNATAFYLRKMNDWSRQELDAMEAAADGLVKDGLFEKEQNHYYLTAAGYARLYERSEIKTERACAVQKLHALPDSSADNAYADNSAPDSAVVSGNHPVTVRPSDYSDASMQPATFQLLPDPR
ncbi:hypothetical protein EKL30_00220 [Candidimonas sp. SYP-B2681]|uniref:hypothetical protein n=1 Tax=Candidimonas sp. SYP-B2681 TaxID=2497686 RepID=UPI000F88F833|nr:hypothetical protein [Candidimonas sp. SYP-B2681]RTZ47476.1 hypothetical protein EKL30_00220 [Candidimonas sp. SYP-B2681]